MFAEIHIEIETVETAGGWDIGRVTWHEDDDQDYGNDANRWYPGIPAEKSNGLYQLAAEESNTFIATVRDREIWETVMVAHYGFPAVENWAIEPEENL